MTSNNDKTRELLFVALKEPVSKKIMYMRYISDPTQKISIKLPQFLIDLPPGMRNYIEERSEFLSSRKEIKDSIMTYLEAKYGNEMPIIYTRIGRRNLVMDVDIHHEHSETLKKLDNKSPSKKLFLDIVFTTIQRRVLELANEPDLSLSGPFELIYSVNPSKSSEPRGERATQELVRSFLLDHCLYEQQVGSDEEPVKIGDSLLTYSWTDAGLGRSVYFNIVADDSPESIRWPKVITKSSFEAEDDPMGFFRFSCGRPWYFRDSLHDYYDKHELKVHLAKDSMDLIFTVPHYIHHVPTMKRCFTAHNNNSAKFYFCDNASQYYLDRYWDFTDLGDSLRPNKKLRPVMQVIDHQSIGREATKEEVYSLLFVEKRRQLRQSR